MDKKLIFGEVDGCLMRDDAPSAGLRGLEARGGFAVYPFTLLSRLKDAKQSAVHHPEGNVWTHTLLVVDEAAKRRSLADDAGVFMWAALLHDIGKPASTQERGGKITAYGHDLKGAELAEQFLSALGADAPFTKNVVRLVRYHMQILFVTRGLPFEDIRGMKASGDMHDIALLCWCDRLGRAGADIGTERENVRLFLQKCGEDPYPDWL